MPKAFETTFTTLTPEERMTLTEAAVKLDVVLSQSEGLFALAVSPQDGSPVDRAYRTDLREAYDLAGLLLFSSQDHLRAIRIILSTGPLPANALYTLLRGAAEADVRARHLLEPAISETIRLARALNERFDSLLEQDKLLDSNQKDHTHRRIANLEMRAAANAIEVRRARQKDGSSGSVIGFGEAVPSEFDLFTRYLPAGSTVMRFLSGYVHSKPWVQLSRRRVAPSGEPGVSLHSTELDVGLFSEVLEVVAALHRQNFQHWLSLGGHDQ